MKVTKEVTQLIQLSLREDFGKGDVTSRLSVPKGKRCRAKIFFREKGVVAGLFLIPLLFSRLDRRVKVRPLAKEGEVIRKNQAVIFLEGPARSVLTGERVALNFISHLSGIATLTRLYVEKVKPYRVKILATRKTTPGWRLLEKHAVKMGGGEVHRMGLYDAILIKENHLFLRPKTRGRSEALKEWVQKIRRQAPKRIILEAEAQSPREVRLLLDTPIDIILLDNLTVSEIRKAVLLRNRKGKRPLLGVSGGVTLQNIRKIARTGVERISVGRMTHSAPALNVSLDIV